MNQYWFIAFIVWTMSVFSAGFYTEHKFNQASLQKEEVKVVTKAQEGQANIIKFHQQLAKIYVKTPCSTTPIPANQLKLLY